MKNSIFLKNIYYMLSYAFQSLNQGTDERIEKEEFDNALDLFAAILSLGIARQLKQGIFREYINRQENLSIMRGKINVRGTVNNMIQHKQKLDCEFDELSENNILNQILKSTAVLLIKSDDVRAEYREKLKKQMLFFSDVDEIDLSSVKCVNLKFHRNNQSYRMLISICQLISEGMLLQSDEKGERKLAKFIDDQRMSRLYEKFLLEYFTRHYQGLDVSASHIQWALDNEISTMLPAMKTDIMLKKDNAVLIIDAKYYSNTTQVQYDKHTVHSANLYQIFTYVKNYDYKFGDKEHSVSGMLLYAKTDEEIQPDNVYQMHGNQISVTTLDLNLPFCDISGQLNKIVKDHFGME